MNKCKFPNAAADFATYEKEKRLLVGGAMQTERDSTACPLHNNKL